MARDEGRCSSAASEQAKVSHTCHRGTTFQETPEFSWNTTWKLLSYIHARPCKSVGDLVTQKRFLPPLPQSKTSLSGVNKLFSAISIYGASLSGFQSLTHHKYILWWASHCLRTCWYIYLCWVESSLQGWWFTWPNADSFLRNNWIWGAYHFATDDIISLVLTFGCSNNYWLY